MLLLIHIEWIDIFPKNRSSAFSIQVQENTEENYYNHATAITSFFSDRGLLIDKSAQVVDVNYITAKGTALFLLIIDTVSFNYRKGATTSLA